jgi:hypothetical protein
MNRIDEVPSRCTFVGAKSLPFRSTVLLFTVSAAPI